MAEDELTQKKKLNPHVKFDEDGNDITSQYYEQQLQALPEHWIKKVDDKGRSGYYNTITDKFSFRRPGGRKKKATTAKIPVVKGGPGLPPPPLPIPPPSDKFLTIDTEKNKLIIKRQFKDDKFKTKCATVAAAMLRKLTNDRNEHRVDKPQTISLDLAFNALGMLRSILDSEEKYNGCFREDMITMNPEMRVYLQKPFLELLSGFGDRPTSLDKKYELFGLREIINTVEDHYKDRIQKNLDNIKVGIVEFDGLAELYKPGTTCIYKRGSGLDIAFKVIWSKYEEGKTLFGKTRIFHIGFQFLISLGNCFTPVDFVDAMSEFKTPREIAKMPFVPLYTMSTRDKEYWTSTMDSRGEMYNKYSIGSHYVGYGEDSFFQFLSRKGSIASRRGSGQTRLRAGGRVMVDTTFAYENGFTTNTGYDPAVHAIKNAFGSFSRMMKTKAQIGQAKDADSKVSSFTSSAISDLDSDMILFTQLPQELYKYTWPTITGFSFTAKAWGQVCVTSFEDIKFNDNAFQQLVLEESRKQLIKALVQYSNETFSDIIRGKGEGSVFLLYGPPGVGKTLTAEAISEMLHRPLYQVSMGELGATAAELEDRLQRVFSVCARWDALVLLDEADVFLEKRTSSGSIARNAMVSVMLRLIEYFQGVLFLTTNRVRSFDPAFQTRITVALKYKSLDENAREKVWKNLLGAAGQENAMEDQQIKVKELAKQPMNGREIKNAIRLALALSKQANDKQLKHEHLVNTVSICSAFHEELDKAEVY